MPCASFTTATRLQHALSLQRLPLEHRRPPQSRQGHPPINIPFSSLVRRVHKSCIVSPFGALDLILSGQAHAAKILGNAVRVQCQLTSLVLSQWAFPQKNRLVILVPILFADRPLSACGLNYIISLPFLTTNAKRKEPMGVLREEHEEYEVGAELWSETVY